MNVALVAMPWSTAKRPSAAVASLAPFVRARVPGHTVECVYAYLDVALELGVAFTSFLEEHAHEHGELLYAALWYPEKRREVTEFMVDALGKSFDPTVESIFSTRTFGARRTIGSIVARTLRVLEDHLERTARSLTANGHRIIGLTTCFGQLYANLGIARRVKALAPETTIVLGGSSVSSEVGVTVLREYDCIDYVVQGEGELPFTAIVERIARGERPDDEPKGILSRANLDRHPRGAALWEVGSMDDLPMPDYDAFAEAADRAGLLWLLPIEGSRGCWWDRGKRTGNAKDTCYFCNLNVQWTGYREKSIDRLVMEIDQASTRYSNTAVFFLDNIIRTKGVTELAEKVARLGKDFILFYELRANIHPYELLCLWEAGLERVQFGIEALSTSVLRRIGKGTTTIKNLQAMKICYELQIENIANLITDFPGTTAEEVEETCRNIRDHALAYQPLNVCAFMPSLDNTVDYLKSQFGIRNPRNADYWKVGLPREVYDRLVFMERSADFDRADWGPVHKEVEQWARVYSAFHGPLDEYGVAIYRHFMFYLDTGSSLRVYRFDVNAAHPKSELLHGLEREVYLHCQEIRGLTDVVRSLTDGSDPARAEVTTFLKRLCAEKLMFEEGGKYLALAPAYTPAMAARRIRKAHEQDQERRQAEREVAPTRGVLPIAP